MATGQASPSTTDSRETPSVECLSLVGWIKDYFPNRVNFHLADQRRCLPPYVINDMGRKGIFGLNIPKEFGGRPLHSKDVFKIIEHLAYFDLTLASFLGVNNFLGAQPIVKFGSNQSKNQMLPDLASGRIFGGIAVTEPDFGSNVANIQSTVEPLGNGVWKMNGIKKWIGNAGWAGVINIFGKVTSPDQDLAQDSFIGFAVPQGTQGLLQGKEELTMGLRSMLQNTVIMKDLIVTDEMRLGQGSGAGVFLDAFTTARISIGAIALGGMRRMLVTSHRYARRRSISDGFLIAKGLTQAKLLEMAIKISILEDLLRVVTDKFDRNSAVPEEYSFAVKVLSSEFLSQVTDSTLQLLGGRGFIESNDVPRFYRDSRILRIFEGPTEVLLTYLGKKTLMSQANNLQKIFAEGNPGSSFNGELQAILSEIENYQKSPQCTSLKLDEIYFHLGWIVCFAVAQASCLQQSLGHNASFSAAIAEWLSAQSTEHCHVIRRIILTKFSPIIDSQFLDSFACAEKYGPLQSQSPGVLVDIDDYLQENERGP
jgi:alkylation response protein AidB-like acyl-CoA dehydrogenase